MPKKSSGYKKPKKKFTSKQILNSKTPHEYVDRLLNSDLTRGEKISLSREWQKISGFTGEDIRAAREKHPYYMEQKREGSSIRIAERIKEHNYSTTKSTRTKEYTKDEINTFLDFNKKDKRGRYEYRDWQVAKEMQTTIPAIQHWRRKYNLIIKIAEKEGSKPTKAYIKKMMKNHEKGLRKMYKEM